MLSNKTKVICLIAFAITASGCSGGGSDEALSPLNDEVNTEVTTATNDTSLAEEASGTEVTNTAETSGGFATPVASVSSSQMDAFIVNPLSSAIPAELNDAAASVSPNGFVANPLSF